MILILLPCFSGRFQKAYQYGELVDEFELDKQCVFLIYSYYMVEGSSVSVMSALISMLSSAGFSDMTKGYVNVLTMRRENLEAWTEAIFDDTDFVCAAFEVAPQLWRSKSMYERTLGFILENHPKFSEVLKSLECMPKGN